LSAIQDPSRRAAEITKTGAWVHKLIKSMIPRFSLDRGFEFKNVVHYGERQCFLQSVLVAGLMQSMGVDAGVAMVSRNIQNTETNSGHAVCLVKLPDSTDIIVDCSDPTPFAEQKGLYVRAPRYKYVLPVYGEHSEIRAYHAASDRADVPVGEVRTLDAGFL